MTYERMLKALVDGANDAGDVHNRLSSLLDGLTGNGKTFDNYVLVCFSGERMLSALSIGSGQALAVISTVIEMMTKDKEFADAIVTATAARIAVNDESVQ